MKWVQKLNQTCYQAVEIHKQFIINLIFYLCGMAKKILVVYLIYTVVVFLFNTYVAKEIYTDALIKAVLSGVVFTALYAFIVMRNDKREQEKKG